MPSGVWEELENYDKAYKQVVWRLKYSVSSGGSISTTVFDKSKIEEAKKMIEAWYEHSPRQ